MLPIKTILHPTDFSDASERARAIAAGLTRDYGARLILMHAVEPSVLAGEPGANEGETGRYRHTVQKRIESLVEAVPPMTVEVVLADGIAAEEVVRVAGERGCDLIVIGSHGRSGLDRVLLGSVAEEVARRAPCPVLIVRAPHQIPHPHRQEPGQGGQN